MRGLALACILLPAFTLPLAGQNAAVDDTAAAYVAADGYVPVEPADLETELAPRLAMPADMASSDVSAVEAALLLVDLAEALRPEAGFIPRLRYVVRVGIEAIDGIELSFVEVERYNLGPAIRLETVAAYGEENTAAPDAFGVGPHVAWRFVTQPAAKSSALLLAAGRKEISEDEAMGRNCLPRPCLSLAPLDDLADWLLVEDGNDTPPPSSYMIAVPETAGGDGEEIEPAALASRLALAAGLAVAGDGPAGPYVAWQLRPSAGAPSRTPFLAVVIDRNLGQEIMTDAALGVSKRGKDSEEFWLRLFGGMQSGAFHGVLQRVDGQLRHAQP